LVAENAEGDATALRGAGFAVDWLKQVPGFWRATVRRGDVGLKIEWAFDSAFRFFPAQPDPELGYRLHDADLAVNKVLAGVGRLVIRDYIDLIHLHGSYLHLGALAWAGTGKDPGLSPLLILSELNRHTRYQPEDLAEVHLCAPVSLQTLKVNWLEMLRSARELVEALPTVDVGCLYLDATGQPVTPDPASPDMVRLRRHHGSLRGTWPRVIDE
jgi:hypothetical protein